jgi:ABC-type glycerol-3-phosphate transport system permease component
MVSRTVESTVRQPRKLVPWRDFMNYALLVIGAFIAVVPFLWMMSASLMTQSEVHQGRLFAAHPNLGNYSQAWSVANFGQYMWNSTRVTGVTIAGLLLFCIPAAYAFARMHFFGRNVIFATLLTTLMIPDVVTLVPNFLTIIWLDRFSKALFGSGWAWFNSWPALSVPFMASAFSIFLLRQFFAQIPNDLWEAAQLDGAGHVRFLIYVIVPLSRAAIMTVVTFAFIGSWNALLWPLLVTQTDNWRPVSAGLANFVNSEAPNDFHLQMAASVIMVLPILAMYFFTQKQFTEGIATSGLKG